MVIPDSADSAAMNRLADRVSGIASVALEGDRVGQRHVKVVPEAWRLAFAGELWIPVCGNWKSGLRGAVESARATGGASRR